MRVRLPVSAAPVDLLQRDDEIAVLEAAVERVARGEGAFVLLNGPAGIGKTSMLRRARDLAEAGGLRTRSAVASELDRSFAYGLVHQLLEADVVASPPDRRAQLLAGGAAHAEVVFDLGQSPVVEPAHAVLHGLYWLCANLADERPVALLVDDLHWGDRASLRFLEYLARRLEGVPLLVVGTTRPGEPGADQDLLDQLAAGAGAQHLVLPPLAEDGGAALIERVLGTAPAPEFVAACLGATGGNPFLLASTAREAQRRGLHGTAAEVSELEGLTGASVVTGLQRRLRALGSTVKDTAEACAVLGGRRTIDDLAAVLDLPTADVRAALDTLSAAAILQPASLEFAHPLIRSAVARGAAPAALADLHARAAARLRDAGARPDELAVHLLAVAPANDPEVVETLRVAARRAAAEGAADAAVPLLRRALEEPAPPSARGELLLELGELEQRIGLPEAMERLGAALGEGLTGGQAARAHQARALYLMTTDPVGALAEFETAMERADDADQRLRIEAGLLDVTAYLASLTPRRAELLDAGRADPGASPAMLAHLAQDTAYRGGPVDQTLDFARRALADGRMLGVVGPTSPTFHLLLLTLRHAERPEFAAELLGDADVIVARQGSFIGKVYADHARAFWNLMFGSVAAAEAFAKSALQVAEQLAAPLPVQSAQIVLAEILIEQDRIDEAVTVVDAVPESPLLDETIIGPDLLSVRAELRLDAGRREEAESDLRRAVAQLERRGWRAPLKSRARLRLAALLAERAPEEAEALARHAVDGARSAGTPGALGAALRAQARVAAVRDTDRAFALLREADAVLDPSPMRLEHAWVLHDLGRLLRTGGQRVDAREPLRRALEIAETAEARLLARRVREELAASGSRPRTAALSGVAALTPSERRVADLAAAGRTNREIAEALWVTRKTVEVHLGKAYGKLGIRTRGELPAALGTDDA